ncbi:MAG: hypothetical protein LBQ69_04465 [Treponema sp.]|jgi:hypothetical protein|nr:hypothetical protein [Treponema sp.]
MKNNAFSFLAAMVLAAFLASCVSLQDRMMSPEEQAEAQIIDTVTDTIAFFQPFHIPQKNRIKAKAYNQLMKIARRKYQGDIDIRNITITGGLSALQIPLIFVGTVATVVSGVLGYSEALTIGIPVTLGVNLIFGFKSVTATGDVVAIGDVVLRDSAQSGSTAPVPGNVPDNALAPGANF